MLAAVIFGVCVDRLWLGLVFVVGLFEVLIKRRCLILCTALALHIVLQAFQ